MSSNNNVAELINLLESRGFSITIKDRSIEPHDKAYLKVTPASIEVNETIGNKAEEVSRLVVVRSFQKYADACHIAIDRGTGIISTISATPDARAVALSPHISRYRNKETDFRYKYNFLGCIWSPDSCSNHMKHMQCSYCKKWRIKK